MDTPKAASSLEKSRTQIATRIRRLRLERRWTQAKLARALRLSQSRLSEIERGAGSFTAEQFLLILKLFNVTANHFAGEARNHEAELQSALARFGARHLQEDDQIMPSETLDVTKAVRDSLVTGTARLVTGLAPVLVANVDRLNLNRLRLDLAEAGFARRLPWLVANTLAALQMQPARSTTVANRNRRASVVLSTFLDALVAARDERGTTPGTAAQTPPDVLDPTIRSQRTRDEVSAAGSSLSSDWGVITRLLPADFAKALKDAEP